MSDVFVRPLVGAEAARVSACVGTRVDGGSRRRQTREWGTHNRQSNRGRRLDVVVSSVPSSERSMFMGGGLERGGSQLLLDLECSKADLGFRKLILQGQGVSPRGGDGSVEAAGMLRHDVCGAPIPPVR